MTLPGVVSKPSRQVPQAGEAVGQVAGAVGGGVQRHDAVDVRAAPPPPRRTRLPVPGVHGALRAAPVHELGRRLLAVLGDAPVSYTHLTLPTIYSV